MDIYCTTEHCSCMGIKQFSAGKAIRCTAESCENKSEPSCGSCKWYAEPEGVCVNDQSEHVADFVWDERGSTDSQTNVKTLPESAVKKKPDIFSDFAHGDKALLESLREFAQMRTRIKKPMTDRAKQMLCNKLEKFDRNDWKAILDQSIYAGWQDIYALKQDDQYEQSTDMEFPRL